MDRIEELKKLGAGDEMCVDCLEGGNPSMDTCRHCIENTPAFTAAVRALAAPGDMFNEAERGE